MMDATWASGRGCAVAISTRGAVELFDDPTDLDRWREHAAPARMVAEVQRQLKLIHRLEKIPDAYAAAFQYWGDDPYGGANQSLVARRTGLDRRGAYDSTPCPHSWAIRGSALCLW